MADRELDLEGQARTLRVAIESTVIVSSLMLLSFNTNTQTLVSMVYFLQLLSLTHIFDLHLPPNLQVYLTQLYEAAAFHRLSSIPMTFGLSTMSPFYSLLANYGTGLLIWFIAQKLMFIKSSFVHGLKTWHFLMYL